MLQKAREDDILAGYFELPVCDCITITSADYRSYRSRCSKSLSTRATLSR